MVRSGNATLSQLGMPAWQGNDMRVQVLQMPGVTFLFQGYVEGGIIPGERSVRQVSMMRTSCDLIVLPSFQRVIRQFIFASPAAPGAETTMPTESGEPGTARKRGGRHGGG